MQHGGGGGGGGASDNAMVVAVRIRPMSPKEAQGGSQCCCKVINGKYVAIAKAGIAGRYLRSQQGSSNEYAFDVAFDAEASQSEVYEHTAKPHVSSVLDGYNVSILAYGATGAGKTFTMMGSSSAAAGDSAPVTGVIPQSLVDIFATIQQRQHALPPHARSQSQWRVFCSYMEVYNEQIYDLIGPAAGRGQSLQLREDPSKGVVVVAGLPEILVHDTAQVLDLLRQGNRNRKTEATAANQVSSRSHAVLQICVRFSTVDAGGNNLVRESKLSLIDLAGSERASATLNRGARLQEGANINKSLLALANCINALSENSGGGKSGNVKYRDSKLTHLLKTSLEGQCKVIMLVNVNPCNAVFDDSHNAIKYGHRAKQIKIRPGEVKMHMSEAPWQEREARLKAANEAMRQELEELKACLLGRDGGGEGGGGGASHRHQHQQHQQQQQYHMNSLLEERGGGMSTLMDVAEEEDEDEDEDEETNNSQNATDTGFNSSSSSSFSHSLHGKGKGKAASSSSSSYSFSSSTGSGDASHRVRELEAKVQEMTLTRKLHSQLVASLEAQKQEKDEELQGQRHLVQTLQRELRGKGQESQSLREMVVHLRTRIDAENHTNYAFTDEDDDVMAFPPRAVKRGTTTAAAAAGAAGSGGGGGGGGGASSSAAATAASGGGGMRARDSSTRGRSSVPMVEALENMFSPIKTVTALGASSGASSSSSSSSSSSAATATAAAPAPFAAAATSRRKSSMTGRGSTGGGAMAATLSSSARAPAAAGVVPAAASSSSSSTSASAPPRKSGTKRRQSQIPRPASHYSTRRATILSSTTNSSSTAGGGPRSLLLPDDEDNKKPAAAAAVPSSSSKKRTWNNALGFVGEKENAFLSSSGSSSSSSSSLFNVDRHSKRRESLLQRPGSALGGSSSSSAAAPPVRTRSGRLSMGPGARF